MNTKSELSTKPTIVVIGAGAAGISSALELAERGYKVDLIEQNTLGSGSSGRNPGRMGHGFHYVDIDTAILYLRSSIQVQRKYPNYLVGQELPFDAPIRHGRYFITKNSDHSPETILKTYEAIRDEYQRLIAEDKDNEVFGPPEKFFRILEPHEYADHVNSDIVSVGIETAEHLFNWHTFAIDIKATILAHPNITLHENTKVENITRGKYGEERFLFHIRNGDSTGMFKSDYLVNSTWHNIEYLNDKLGLPMLPNSRTNRLKTLLKVTLPDSLREVNSMFFCMGQHCMISNMGNGQAMMTFARVTNLDASCDLTLSENTQRLLDGGATQAEKNDIAQQMLQGVAHYIPQMAHATVDDVMFGIVQTQGKLTLEQLADPQNAFHKRDYSGIREEQVGVISNPCIKLFYFVENGQKTADLIDQHVKTTQLLKQAINEIADKAKAVRLVMRSEHKKDILDQLERDRSYFLLTDTRAIVKKFDSYSKIGEESYITPVKESVKRVPSDPTFFQPFDSRVLSEPQTPKKSRMFYSA